MKILAKHYWKLAAFVGVSCGFVALLTSLVLADVPQPVLRITPLGSNHFSITIINGVTNVNYELHWRPVLGDPNYPWQVLDSGDPGETNWVINAGTLQSSFFRASVGNDADGDGVLNWQDADPYNASIGILTITIESPVNGAQIQ